MTIWHRISGDRWTARGHWSEHIVLELSFEVNENTVHLIVQDQTERKVISRITVPKDKLKKAVEQL